MGQTEIQMLLHVRHSTIYHVLKDLISTYPNDQDLGEFIRKIVNDEQDRRSSKTREKESIGLS